MTLSGRTAVHDFILFALHTYTFRPLSFSTQFITSHASHIRSSLSDSVHASSNRVRTD